MNPQSLHYFKCSPFLEGTNIVSNKQKPSYFSGICYLGQAISLYKVVLGSSGFTSTFTTQLPATYSCSRRKTDCNANSTIIGLGANDAAQTARAPLSRLEVSLSACLKGSKKVI